MENVINQFHLYLCSFKLVGVSFRLAEFSLPGVSEVSIYSQENICICPSAIDIASEHSYLVCMNYIKKQISKYMIWEQMDSQGLILYAECSVRGAELP